MATIEPRLIHLLNDEPARPEPSTADLHQLPSLPSLQLPTHASTRDGPLPPLQLDGLRSDSFLGSSGRHAALPSINGGGHAVTSSPARDQATTASPDHKKDSDYSKEGKYAGSSGVFPLRLLLSDVPPMSVSAPPAPYLSFSSILNDDGPDFHDDAHLPSLSSLYASGTAAASASTAAISASAAASASTSTSTTSTSTSTSISATTSAFASTSTPLTPPPAAVSISTTSPSTTSNSKKRPAIHIKDDFLQLPQPAKKPKAHQAPFMPPIINGLFEPPPNVALFPPISSSAFDDTDAGQSKLLHELSYSPPGPRMSPEPDQPVPKPRTSRKRSSKPRRKWSEEETNHLLMGVDRHGVGRWTNILDDPDFLFNSRSAGDLKDRFRTCCPEEMRVIDVHRTKARAKGPLVNKTSLPSKPEKPNNESPDTVMADAGDVLSSKDQQASFSPSGFSDDRPARKTRAHRMRVSDLVGLGITGPFKKARRRERTTFTTRDDQEILQGLETYGPTWTKIQRDKRFHLGNRKPTDLRDRVRNKYPYIYQRIEKGIFQPKDVSTNNILEPMVNMTISHSFQAAPTKRGETPKEPQKWSFLVTNSSDQSQSRSQ
ncbi:hypothetical protein TGAMA5MH_10831 [Trichoderma gamsii]|uniref:Myb-like domain-containing protein n=1 Tax=Trichoderma gamsii TaxID=398673 RepID=A0A2K0SVG3_9HYPO|nr:hypothetical protein TGAMA5MH_10831 [Trichoderma gamsii]